jgi:hypothetical protein
VSVGFKLIKQKFSNSLKLGEKTNEKMIVTGLLIVAALVRLRNLNSPISGSYTFRTTQTASGIRSVANGVLSPFSVETPVLGAPWKIPFEFPLYQIIAGLFSRLTGITVEASGRIVSLLFFISTAIVFYMICRKFFEVATSIVALVIFLFNSHNMEYGSSVLIEYCALFFSLLAFLFAYRYLQTQVFRSLLYFLPAASLAALVKITTSIIWVFIGIIAIIYIEKRKQKTAYYILLAAIVAHLPAYAWTRWADHQKESSLMTEWLSSANLKEWNFGTLRQRMFYFDWQRTLGNIFFPSVAGGTLIAVGLIILAVSFGKHRRASFGLLIVFISGPVLFTNLYFVHDYYWTAALPAFLFVLAAGLEVLPSAWIRNSENSTKQSIVFRASVSVAIVVASWFTPYGMRHFDVFAKEGSVSYSDDAIAVAVEAITTNTKPDDKIIIIGADWNPQILYFSDRKGLMIPNGWDPTETLNKIDSLSSYRFIYFYSDADAKLFTQGANSVSLMEPITKKLFRIKFD